MVLLDFTSEKQFSSLAKRERRAKENGRIATASSSFLILNAQNFNKIRLRISSQSTTLKPKCTKF